MLTDEDRRRINEIADTRGDTGYQLFWERIYLAGKRAGNTEGFNEGLERAAQYCEDDATWDSEHHDMWYVGFEAACQDCAAAIRALKERT